MTPEQALSKLRTLEVDGATELASVLETALSKADNKNSELIGEMRNRSQRNLSLGETLEAVAKGLGLEGVIERDTQGTYLLGEKASELPVAVQGLRRSSDELKTKAEAFEQQLTEATSKVQTFERKGKLQELAAVAGANPAVLERLFPDLDTLAVVDGAVKLGEKPLREALEADEGMKAFIPALFPGGANPKPEPEKKNQQTLPSGGPGGNDGKKDLLGRYTDRHYSGAKALVAKAPDS